MKRFFLFFVVAILATLSALHLSNPPRQDGIAPSEPMSLQEIFSPRSI